MEEVESSKLAVARYRKGWSQQQVAEAVGAARSTLSQWERGVQVPQEFYVQRLCDFYQMTRAELGLDGLARYRSRKIASKSKQDRTSSLAADSTKAGTSIPHERQDTPSVMQVQSERGITSPILPLYSASSTELDTLDIIRSRRQTLHGILHTACAALMLSPGLLLQPEDQKRLERAILNPSQASKAVLDDLSSITNSYWRLGANASFDLISGLIGHFTTLADLLKWSHPTTVYLRLCSLLSENAQILGKTLYDMKEYNLAWTYYAFSVKAAKEAQNDDLCAVGLGRMALLLIYCGQPHNALSLIQRASQASIHHARIRAWLAAVEAEIHATLMDERACTCALDRSKNATNTLTSQTDMYATGFDISRQLGYEGACFVRLHRPERAVSALQKALDVTSPTAMRRSATLYADMSKAYVQLGNVEQACLFAQRALAITTHVKSLSTLQRLVSVRSELEPWRENAEVKKLNEQFIEAIAAIVKTEAML